jgi:CRP-like cAMP-binding protein
MIRKVPLFADMDRRELESLASSFKERTFSAGNTVASEGSGGVGFFIIEDGTAKVSRRGEELATLGPGDHFGEIALIDEGERTATITAETDLRCYGLTSWEFRPLVETNSGIAWKLLQTMAKRLRESQGRE